MAREQSTKENQDNNLFGWCGIPKLSQDPAEAARAASQQQNSNTTRKQENQQKTVLCILHVVEVVMSHIHCPDWITATMFHLTTLYFHGTP